MDIMDITSINNYVINLEKNKNKYERAQKQFEAIGIHTNRFNAIYASDLDPSYIREITYPSVQYTIKKGRNIDSDIGTAGAIGCFLSHVELWKMLLASDSEYLFILEDDAKPVSTTNEINKFINDVKTTDPNWDIIFLGWAKPFPSYNEDIKVSDKISKINEITFQTHSYLISRKGANTLLKNAFPIVHQVDSYISYLACRGDINAYRGKNYITQNNIEGSDIQTDYNFKKFINRFTESSVRFYTILTVSLIVLLLMILYKKCN